MGDYFWHWLKTRPAAGPAQVPRVFYGHCVPEDANGTFLWSGFGDNSRALKWLVGRLEGNADATEAPIGNVPGKEALGLSGLDLSDEQIDLRLAVDTDAWRD